MSMSMSSCFRDGEAMSMDSLPDELHKRVFRRLSLFDILRARAVCKRWRTNLNDVAAKFRHESSSTAQPLCPLVFTRTARQHDWCGFDSTRRIWQPLPSLVSLPQVNIRPLAGNGKTLIGFKITSAPSQVVVGNPVTSTWQIIPTSTEAWGEVGNILLVDRTDSTSFQIIAVREDATEIFDSTLGVWTKLRSRPPEGVHEITVLSIRDRHISATLCGDVLFCYGKHPSGNAIVVSFDVQNERWTDDRIAIPPHASSKFVQLVECGGNLFAAIEDAATTTVAIWGLGLQSREFSAMAKMPAQFYTLLCKPRPSRQPPQLKAVGQQHRMFFWRNFPNQTLRIVVFDFLLRTWDALPEFDQAIGYVPSERDELQIFVDAASFEP